MPDGHYVSSCLFVPLSHPPSNQDIARYSNGWNIDKSGTVVGWRYRLFWLLSSRAVGSAFAFSPRGLQQGQATARPTALCVCLAVAVAWPCWPKPRSDPDALSRGSRRGL